MKRISLLLLVSGIILAGCETVPTTEEAAQQAIENTQNKVSDAVVGEIKNGKITYVQQTASAVDSLPVAVPETRYVMLSFTKMSAKLDSIALQQVEQMLPKLKMAKKITITGYCDQKAIRNAKRAALARADAVKAELIKQGIDANAINTLSITKERRHAALVTIEVG